MSGRNLVRAEWPESDVDEGITIVHSTDLVSFMIMSKSVGICVRLFVFCCSFDSPLQVTIDHFVAKLFVVASVFYMMMILMKVRTMVYQGSETETKKSPTGGLRRYDQNHNKYHAYQE